MRLALSILTLLPVGQPRAEPTDVSRAMALAPAVGLGVGAAAAGVLALVQLAPHTDVLAAALAIATLAVASRLLHLDGLADTADALGFKGDRAEAVAVMKSPEIGAFGAVTVALVLIVDVAALTVTTFEHRGVVCVLVASTASRLTISFCCRHGLSAAEGSRLGAWVAGTVKPVALMATASATAAVATGLGATWSASAVRGGVQSLAALATAVAVGEAVRFMASRRVDGLTGDVIGASVECSFAAACMTFALSGALVS